MKPEIITSKISPERFKKHAETSHIELEYTSMINTRPRDKNYAQEIQDKRLQKRVREIAEKLLLQPYESIT